MTKICHETKKGRVQTCSMYLTSFIKRFLVKLCATPSCKFQVLLQTFSLVNVFHLRTTCIFLKEISEMFSSFLFDVTVHTRLRCGAKKKREVVGVGIKVGCPSPGPFCM